MPCGCFGGGGGNVGKPTQPDAGDKYKPKDTKPLKPPPITTKPPPVCQDPIPNPVKTAQPLNTSAPPPTKPAAPAGSSPGNDDPDKANRRRDVVASYYSDECELLAYKTTDSRPSSQVEGGGSSPPVATSSPTPSSPASTRSAASTRADLAEKRREFFKPLVGSELERSGGGTLPPHHSHSLLEEHERQLEHYHEPTVKDQVHKFEHLPEDLATTTGNGNGNSSKRETEVRLGRNSRSTTVVITPTGDKQQSNHKHQQHLVSHIDNELSPEQQKQEQQLVNKAALHNQLLGADGGQVNLRPTPKQKEPMPNMTFTAPDQPHDDNCIVMTTPAVTPTPDDNDDDITAWVTPTPAKPPPKPAHTLPPEQHDHHAQAYSPISEPTPIITETKHLPAETQPLLTETEPLLTETEPLLTETEPYYTETEPHYTETEPRLTETEPIIRETEPLITETEPVSEPQHIYTIPGPVVTEPQHVNIIPEHVIEPELVFSQPEPIAQPDPFVAESEHKNVTEHEPQHFTEFTHVEEPIFSLEKTGPVLECESDVTESFICETNDTTPLAAASVTEQMSSDMEDAFIKQETEMISVIQENKKNIISSRSEQMPFETHTEIKTEIIHSEPSSIIESNSDITKSQEIVSQMENIMHGSPQECFGLSETTSNEENISIISKTEPIEVDQMTMDFTTGISQSEHLVSVNSSDEAGTTHTETSKSIVTDEDGNTTIHTETLTTKTITSSELIPETLTIDPFTDRTMVCIRESSSSLVDEESSESSFLVAEGSLSDKVTKSMAHMIHDDHQQQPDIQSTLDSSLPPVTHIGLSLSPSSSPRNSSHSSPSPPASPDSPRTQKLGMVELQYEQEPVAQHQIQQEVQESKDHANPEDHITNNSVVNNQDAPKVHGVIDVANLATGHPSLSMESPNPHTCNEADDVTAPASLEDDGLGSEIDDALDSTDCFSEEVSTHNNQHHHQSVPAPPPPSSAS